MLRVTKVVTDVAACVHDGGLDVFIPEKITLNGQVDSVM